MTSITFNPIIPALMAALFLVFQAFYPVQAQEWHVMDKLGEVESSKCVGDPKTPMCAVGTYFACDHRADNRLCEKVNAPPFDLSLYRADLTTRLFLYLYRETGRITLQEKDISRIEHEGRRISPEAGDIAVKTIMHACVPDVRCVEKIEKKEPLNLEEAKKCRSVQYCNEFPPDESVTLVRKSGEQWSYVGSYSPSDLHLSFPTNK
tara:strand:- start:859 stop:1476 length:618 start_codon:yes stop_codon:yes gene_type:complete